ncbi:MAG TPA: hypothetical protein VGA88_08295 [Burkholderiales bacterium]
MSVNNIAAGVSADFRAATTRFFLPGAAEFSSTLNLGQIIKGQVMRQYDGNRYLVDFGGHERVVDSSVPLSTGELIHGRVVALGERVEVQRIQPRAENTTGTATAAESPPNPASAFKRHERIIDNLSTRYRATLDAADKAVLTRASRTAGDASAMALAGVLVNKLGLRQSPDLLWPVYRALLREDASSAALYNIQNIPELTVITGGDAGMQAAAVRSLAEALVKQMGHDPARNEVKDVSANAAGTTPENKTPVPIALIGPKAAQNPQDDEESGDPRWVAQRLLNAQTGGTVAHRIGTVPFLLGDQLIEVDLAFFEQRREAAPAPQTQHRKLMFSLATEHLGNVEIGANVVGSRVRLHVATGDREATTELASQVEALRTALTSGGQWEIDEIVYETRHVDSYNGAVRSVVEHVVSQDSLNRLV